MGYNINTINKHLQQVLLLLAFTRINEENKIYLISILYNEMKSVTEVY